MGLMGCVIKMDNLRMTVALPHGLYGKVSAMEISEPFSDLIKKAANSEDGHNIAPDLHSIFRIGQYLRCVVIGKPKEKDKTQFLKLSLRPTMLNAQLELEMVKEGFYLYGAVKSVEDHGYNITFGEDLDLVGFLANDNCSSTLKVGQLISAKVLEVTQGGNVAQLSLNDSESAKYKVQFSLEKNFVVNEICSNFFFLP